ncbi:hypothetical protein FRC11_010518, partial [Ceratobasidium sp. 423]
MSMVRTSSLKDEVHPSHKQSPRVRHKADEPSRSTKAAIHELPASTIVIIKLPPNTESTNEVKQDGAVNRRKRRDSKSPRVID